MNTKMLSTLFFSVVLKSLSSQVTPFAGNGSIGYSGDGGPASQASLNRIAHATSDASGNFYISDIGNYDVRKVNTPGIISTYAGSQVTGYSGDGGASTLATLGGNTINKLDAAGNLYILDQYGNHIRKVTPSGMIATVAGAAHTSTVNSGYTGDGGPAVSAEIAASDMAVDGAGNIYICQFNNHVVRKITPSGIITTIAGNGTMGFSGDGGLATAAQLYMPVSLELDNAGNLFVMDVGNNRIRKVNTSGVITTYAGSGNSGYSGDGGAATSGDLRFAGLILITGGRIAFNTSNELCFIAFSTTQKINIRKVSGSGVLSTVVDSTSFTGLGNDLAYIHIDQSNNLYFTSATNFCGVDYIPGAPIMKLSLNPGSTTGVEAMDFDNRLVSLYPLPSAGILTLKTNLLKDASVSIVEIGGKEVYSASLSQAETKLDLSHIANGTYIARISGNGVTITKQLLVQK